MFGTLLKAGQFQGVLGVVDDMASRFSDALKCCLSDLFILLVIIYVSFELFYFNQFLDSFKPGIVVLELKLPDFLLVLHVLVGKLLNVCVQVKHIIFRENDHVHRLLMAAYMPR